MMIEVIMWSAKYDKNTAAEVKFVNRVRKDKDELLKEINFRLKNELINL